MWVNLQWAKQQISTKSSCFWSQSNTICQTRTSTPYVSRVGGVELENCGAGGVELVLVEWSAVTPDFRKKPNT